MKRNEVRQRESRGEGVEERKVSDKRDEGECVCVYVCGWVGGKDKVFVTLLTERD